MSLTHFEDQVLQSIAEGAVIDPSMQQHLENCKQCRMSVEVYRQIYSLLQEESIQTLPSGFAESVTARLAKSKARVVLWWDFTLFLAAFAVGLALIFHFTGVGGYYRELNLLSVLTLRLQELFDDLTLLFNGSPGLLFFAVLALVLFGLMDKLLFWLRKTTLHHS